MFSSHAVVYFRSKGVGGMLSISHYLGGKQFSITWEALKAEKEKKCLFLKSSGKNIIEKSRKLISHEVFKLEKNLIPQIKRFKMFFPYICDTYKIKMYLRYVHFRKYRIL